MAMISGSMWHCHVYYPGDALRPARPSWPSRRRRGNRAGRRGCRRRRLHARCRIRHPRVRDARASPRRIADFRLQPVGDERLTVPWRGGELPARRYRPFLPSERPILLVPGVHAAGVDEPRLDGFARNLAAHGPPRCCRRLARSGALPHHAPHDGHDRGCGALAQRPAHREPAPEAIGIIGISFGGGLSIVAASRLPSVAWVLSFGGHGDLPRTLRYLCTGIPAGRRASPAPRLRRRHHPARRRPNVWCPPIRSSRCETAILTFLEASHVDMVDKPRAAGIFERARTMAADAWRTRTNADDLRQHPRRRRISARRCCRMYLQ